MDKNKLLNFCLSKTINKFHYFIEIKTKLMKNLSICVAKTTPNNKFIILCCLKTQKQHKIINLFLCQYLFFEMVNLSFNVEYR